MSWHLVLTFYNGWNTRAVLMLKRKENDSTSLVGFDSGNIMCEKAGGTQRSCFWVFNKHQRHDLPFLPSNEYFAAVVTVSSANQYPSAPFSINGLSISKAFSVKMKDDSLCALICQDCDFCLHVKPAERSLLTRVCVVWIRRQLNIFKAIVCFSVSSQAFKCREQRNQCIDPL